MARRSKRSKRRASEAVSDEADKPIEKEHAEEEEEDEPPGDDDQRRCRHMPFISMEEKDDIKLRFAIGAEVACNMGDEWAEGRALYTCWLPVRLLRRLSGQAQRRRLPHLFEDRRLLACPRPPRRRRGTPSRMPPRRGTCNRRSSTG